MEKPLIGFIGQGFIGKNYADDFEERGYRVVRYSLEEPYVANKEKIKECDIVFIAVWTPTLPSGEKRDDGMPRVYFDDRIVREVVSLVGKNKIAVIKSTIIPGTTNSIQNENKDIIILHSPEFLSEKTAAKDARNPERNIIGIPIDSEEYRNAAEKVMSILPEAPYKLICSAITAEHIKYANNGILFLKTVFAHVMKEIADKNGANWEEIRSALSADPRVGPSHLDPRGGAGRSCFIKDFGALSEMYQKMFPEEGSAIMGIRGFEYKNNELLRENNRYIDLLEGVYGKDAGIKKKKNGQI